MADVDKSIRLYALQNAIKYNGQAQIGAVLGKILGEFPEQKKDVPALKKRIEKILKEVNVIPVEKQTAELREKAPELLEKPKTEEKELKDLPDAVSGKVVMRFAPSPSGALHLGRAIVLSLNYLYVQKYKGKLILRLEDTNPEGIFKEAYKLIEEDAQWLTKKGVNKTIIQSDRLGSYYDCIEKLVKKGVAYVCTCEQDAFRELIMKCTACPCRNLSVEENHLRWNKMFGEFKPGEAVVRIKTDVNHKNPAMRDWPAARINDHTHPRTGTEHRVWPLMNLAVAVDDHELGVTHSIRGKDHADNEKRQKYVFDAMGWKPPVQLYIGRINFIGMDLSTRQTKLDIENGKYSGWDDIRLPTLRALSKRGYQQDAFLRYAQEMGISLTDKTVSSEEFFKIIDAFNRDIIDPVAKRFFFVNNPVKIIVEGAPEQTVKLQKHPSNKKLGERTMKSSNAFLISSDDFAGIKANNLYRLMECINFTKKGSKLAFSSTTVDEFREKGDKIMHWLPESHELLNVEVVMPDKSIVKGLGEPALSELKVGEIIQFERRYFARLDEKKGNTLIFWYLHK